MSEAPLMIVADTYAAARLYAREHDLGPENRAWRYVSSPMQVRGYRGGQYVTIWGGDLSPYDTSRFQAIEVLRMAGFTRVEDA